MLYWLWLIGKLFCKHLFYRPYEFQYFIFYSWEIFWDYFTFPWTINNLFSQFVPMTGILENHIIFMILESFPGTVLPSLLVGCVHFQMIFIGCIASKHIPIFLHLLITVFSMCVLGGGNGNCIYWKCPVPLYFWYNLIMEI